MHTKLSLVAAALALCCTTASAKVTLPSVYTSNMVVQQNSILKIHGKAAADAAVEVNVSWSKKPFATKSDRRGQWCIELPTPKAGGPYTMRFFDGEAVQLDNVMVGEVWLGSGQSNMEMPMAGWGKVFDYEAEIARANYPQIRLFQVKKVVDTKERDRYSLEYNMGGWQECSPKTVENFSALCYYFALRLWEDLGVPVGIIDDDWGGTPGQAWVRAEALGKVEGFAGQLDWMKSFDKSKNLADEMKKAEEQWKAELKSRDTGLSAARPWYGLDIDDSRWNTMTLPQMFADSFDGVVWYRKTITLAADQAGKELTLSLGAIDDEDITYFNGERIGSTDFWNTFRTYKVPANLVREGENVIAIRAFDQASEGGFSGKPEEMFAQIGDKKISLAGEWRYAIGLDVAHLPKPHAVKVDQYSPTVLYNAMINPLVEFPVKGIIWYQGCTNVGAAQQYEHIFRTLIQDWRRQWNQPDMPFLFAQLANYLTPADVQPNSQWALLREAQEKALALHHTGMALNIDIGDARDIHPKSKRELGRRMAAIALHNTYGQKKTTYTAPIYKGYTIVGDEVHIEFHQPQGSEPFIQGKNLPGFTIAGADGKWYVGTARTEGNKVIVYSNKVSSPAAVRYGWADNPTCTLHTASGFPVAPFRTDNWPITK